MMTLRKLLVWIVVVVCVLIAAFISASSISLTFVCSTAADMALPELSLFSVESFDTRDAKSTGSTPEEVQRGCDYTVGKWVKSNQKSYYAGDKCKQWLSGMWACRLMPDRPNFDYESYRWQPETCDLPIFRSQEFFSRMKNKVLAFVGDSIGRQQYQSLMCMLTGGQDDVAVEDVGALYGLVKPKGALRADGVAQRFLETNTTVIFYWSASLCDIQPLNQTDPNTDYALHLDRPTMFLQKFVSGMDVVVLNTGHHWNKGKIANNKWVMHVSGDMVKDPKFGNIEYARNFSLSKIVSWLDDQILHNRIRAQIFMRSLSPRHFFEGEWDSGGRCDNNLISVEEKDVTGQEARDPIAEGAVLGTRIHLLNITYISLFRDEAHISKYRPNQNGQDCLHWCLPGVPDVWNELLYAKLLFNDDTSSRTAL